MPFAQRVVSPIYVSRNKRVPVPPSSSSSTSVTTTTNNNNNNAGTAIIVKQNQQYQKQQQQQQHQQQQYQHQLQQNQLKCIATINGGIETDKDRNGGTTGATIAVHATISDYEFEAVTNLTLSNALRQLASLVLIANDIFTELNKELHEIGDRAKTIKQRIDVLDKKVDEFDPKMVAVPESDLETFVQIKNHFQSKRCIDTSLFTPATRSTNLQQLYDAAAKTPVDAMVEMDRILGQNDRRSSDIFLCTPVLGQNRRRMKSNIDVEIETRMPAAVEELRKWTSTEAIGDITVTPDCISRVGYNSILHNNSTLVNSASHSMVTTHVMSIDDVVDATASNRINEVSNDMPLDHRLPSPEEQCQMIALRFPAELIKVDTSGKRFERMCTARKSMNAVTITIGEQNNLNDEIQTVKRRSRSRKPKHKRRNTIAGTDQKEIEEAVNGDNETTVHVPTAEDDNKTNSYVPRSKSNDILKKDSPTAMATAASTLTDISKTVPRMSHFNSLKQWGRNRLRLMNRNSCHNDTDANSSASSSNNKKDNKDKVCDIVDDSNVYETVISKNKRKFMEKERKLSHERKPSYSSSEKSLTITSNSLHSVIVPASINPVKLRESSAIRRQRRNGLGHKDELNSSSGNWSASSESGRTSIGSEITAQPKSSASSTSLNHSHHPGSGPPSSIISRRRFLNTSASSSVTSEGTVTPDIQVHDSYDDETSSAYSCDTEGYYTSFHVDSGLKTLKEEEPVTPLHTSSALSSTNSFSSVNNRTVLSAENEYELFGKGSTSTTASSAGTVCTTLMAANSDRSLVNVPAVPERKSSLTKLNRSNSNASSSTLERSYSSSTVGSTLERSGTIKRNGILLKKEVTVVVHETQPIRIESPDSGNNTSSSPIETNSNASPTQGVRSNSEYDYSECSDLEGVERVERIRVKTTINSSRIPSLCVITPTNSDDEEVNQNQKKKEENCQRERFASPVRETNLDSLEFNMDVPEPKIDGQVQIMTINKETGYATIHTMENPSTQSKLQPELKKDVQHIKKSTLQPLNNMFGRLRGVLPHLKKSPIKDPDDTTATEPIYDNAGEYVTISDVTNNNQKKSGYHWNDVLRKNLATVLSGNLNEETEYVSLNELPASIRCESNLLSSLQSSPERDCKINSDLNNMNECVSSTHDCDEALNRRGGGSSTGTGNSGGGGGARVTLDAQGKVVYNSDSLKRRKGAHTTFAPGPCVKDINSGTSSNNATSSSLNIPLSGVSTGTGIGVVSNRKATVVRPVISQSLHKPIPQVKFENSKQVDKIVIKADSSAGGSTKEVVRMPVATVGPTSTVPISIQTAPLQLSSTTTNSDMAGTGNVLKGAYVNVQGNGNLKFVSNISSMDSTINNQGSKGKSYQHLCPDEIDNSTGPIPERIPYVPSTLPRHSSNTPGHSLQCNDPQSDPKANSPFQRSNNVYWTLQTKKQLNNKTEYGNTQPPSKDDIVVANKSSVPIEELYSIPNKLRNKRSDLRPTPLGFSTFFSPVSKSNTDTPSTPDNAKISPIDPRNMGSFQTSTPSKVDDQSKSLNRSLSNDFRNRLSIRETNSGSNSPSSGRSTPRMYLEPQSGRHTESNDLSQTCLDRLGTPKTSLMDFKKLLLSKATKNNDAKSAVEQLKLSKDSTSKQQPSNVNTSLNILDLSGSPKTFATRRMIRQGNFGSPSKQSSPSAPKHMSPRSQWKFNNYRTDVMSTAIPEVNSEEDSSPNNSTDRHSSQQQQQSDLIGQVSPEPSSVVEEALNMKNNIFLQAEENNFMKCEQTVGKPLNYGLSRAGLTQARNQFLMNENVSTFHRQKLAQFKDEHYTGLITSAGPVESVNNDRSIIQHQTQHLQQQQQHQEQQQQQQQHQQHQQQTSVDGQMPPSLETAL